jgi:hypothetical protein
MKRHRTIASILVAPVVLVGLAGLAPTSALAGGPLLSGYGSPGAGSQSIIGATLLNGPRGGGSGGSGSGSSSSSSSSSSSFSSSGAPVYHSQGGPTSSVSGGSQGVAGPAAHVAGGNQGTGKRAGGAGTGPRTPHTGSKPSTSGAGTYTNSAQLGASATAAVSAPWFSGGDLLALVLVAAVLSLMAVATVRLGRTQHD